MEIELGGYRIIVLSGNCRTLKSPCCGEGEATAVGKELLFEKFVSVLGNYSANDTSSLPFSLAVAAAYQTVMEEVRMDLILAV